MMGRSALSLLLCACLVPAAAGCGGSNGDKTFDESGYPFTFTYPGDLEEGKLTGVKIPGGKAVKAFGLDERNLITTAKVDVGVPLAPGGKITDRVKADWDNGASQTLGRRVSSTRVEVGGLPGLEYRAAPKAGVRTRVTSLFDGKTEYLISCQATGAKREELNEACQQALDTLKKKK